MKTIIAKSILFVLMTATLVVSCTPNIKVTTDYDRSANFSAYRTFTVENFSINVNDLNAHRISNSITSEMIKKGYTETDINPDLVINAISVLKDKKYISATNNGVYGPFGYRAGDNTVARVYDYKDGSLIIDVVDIKTNRLVWEGKGHAEIMKQPKNHDKAISQAVEKIMNAFPRRSTN